MKRLKIWWIAQVPMKAFEVEVFTLVEAKLLLNSLALYDQFQLDHNLKPDYANAGGLVYLDKGEWVDWNSSDDEKFMEFCNQLYPEPDKSECGIDEFTLEEIRAIEAEMFKALNIAVG